MWFTPSFPAAHTSFCPLCFRLDTSNHIKSEDRRGITVLNILHKFLDINIQVKTVYMEEPCSLPKFFSTWLIYDEVTPSSVNCHKTQI